MLKGFLQLPTDGESSKTRVWSLRS